MNEMVMEKQDGQWETKVKGASCYADGSSIVRPAELEWTAGPFDGLSFKMTGLNRQNGAWTAFIKADPNAVIPAHYAHTQSQIFVREGSLTVEGHVLGKGDYLMSNAGKTAERKVGPEGAMMWVASEGGFSALDASGKPAGNYMDGASLFDLAKANGAADHLVILAG